MGERKKAIGGTQHKLRVDGTVVLTKSGGEARNCCTTPMESFHHLWPDEPIVDVKLHCRGRFIAGSLECWRGISGPRCRIPGQRRRFRLVGCVWINCPNFTTCTYILIGFLLRSNSTKTLVLCGPKPAKIWNKRIKPAKAAGGRWTLGLNKFGSWEVSML